MSRTPFFVLRRLRHGAFDAADDFQLRQRADARTGRSQLAHSYRVRAHAHASDVDVSDSRRLHRHV